MYDFSGKTTKIGFKKGSLEAEYIDDLIIIKGAPEIIKNRYNSFFNTDLADLLNKLKVHRVVIVGFMTSFCCESAARDAHDRDYHVDFIIDATGVLSRGRFFWQLPNRFSLYPNQNIYLPFRSIGFSIPIVVLNYLFQESSFLHTNY